MSEQAVPDAKPSPRARWEQLARAHDSGSSSSAEELAALMPEVMSTCVEDPGDLFRLVEVGGAVEPDSVWRGLLAIHALHHEANRTVLLEVLGEVFGHFPPSPPSDPSLAQSVEAALADLPKHLAEPLAPRKAGGGVSGRVSVDGGIVAVVSADLLRSDPPTSEEAWRAAHERGDAAVFALGGDGSFEFTLEVGPPPSGLDVVCWPVFFRGGATLFAGMDAAALGPFDNMHQVAAAMSEGALRLFVSPEPTTPPSEGYPLSLA